MLCYKGKTFCPFNDCASFSACPSALTESVKQGAIKWMGEDAPIAQLTNKPDCFKKPSPADHWEGASVHLEDGDD